MKTIKKNREIKQRINIETYLKKIKTKKREYEEKKQKLKEYQKNYRVAKM